MDNIQAIKNEGTFENRESLYNQLYEAENELYTVLMALNGLMKPCEIQEETEIEILSGCITHIDSILKTVKSVRDEGYSNGVDQPDFEGFVVELLYIRVGLNSLQGSKYFDQDRMYQGFHQALWKAINQLIELEKRYEN